LKVPEFEREMIDRLARMETRMEEMFRRQDVLFEKIDTILDNCDAEGDRLTSIEGTLYGGSLDKQDAGLSGRVDALEDRVQGLTLKAAAIGGAAALLGTLGLNVPGWLQR
jgi:hypothetical protein